MWAIIFEQQQYTSKGGFKKPIIWSDKDGRMAIFRTRAQARAYISPPCFSWDGRVYVCKVRGDLEPRAYKPDAAEYAKNSWPTDQWPELFNKPQNK